MDPSSELLELLQEIIDLLTQINDACQLTNLILAALVCFVGVVAGIGLLRNLWRRF